MSEDLCVIVPSRGRPESVARVVQAWNETHAWNDARLVFVIDADDPRYAEYFEHHASPPELGACVYITTMDEWKPLVPKLNEAARLAAENFKYVAFMGDDHLPRTDGWTEAFISNLGDLKTGIVYGDDGYQGQRLPTHWAMTSDIVRSLGRMVPAPVDHLYCDNAIKVLGQGADCLRYLPDVLIEHMHPMAGKAESDAGYERVNAPVQYRKDELAYLRWIADGRAADVETVRKLRRENGE